MINIKEEIQVVLVRSGISMRKLIEKMNSCGYEIPAPGNLSSMFSKKRVRFETVQEILDFLGYEVKISKKP